MKDDQNHKNLDWIGSFKKKKSARIGWDFGFNFQNQSNSIQAE